MAVRVRRWALGTLGGMALLAVLLLPPTPRLGWLFGALYRPLEDRTPSEWVEENLGKELRAAGFLLKRTARLDTVRTLLAAADREPGGILTLPSDAQDPEVLETIGVAAQREMDRPRPRRSALTVVLVTLDGDLGGESYPGPTYTFGLDLDEERYVIPGPGPGHCVVLIPTRPDSIQGWWDNLRTRYQAILEDTLRTSQLLGPCRLYGRYGLPGTRILAWLRAVGHRHALRWTPDSAQLPAEPTPARRTVFGIFDSWDFDLRMEECVAGRREACRRILLEGFASPLPPFQSMRWMQRAVQLAGTHIPELDLSQLESGLGIPGLLSQLENWYGEERFQSFWSSEEPVEEAFHAAFGLDAGEWFYQWAQAAVGTDPSTPRLPLPDLILSLGLLGGLAALVAAVAHRRRLA